MARRSKRQEHDDHNRWLISYADFVTLLFAFFVVMYAISSVNEKKYGSFIDSLNVAFKTQPTPLPAPDTTTEPPPKDMTNKTVVDERTARLGEAQRKIQDRMLVLADSLKQVMATMISQEMVTVELTKRGVVINLSASSLFKTGDAALQPEVLVVLRQVAAVLNAENQPIEIEGHSDDVPINTPLFPSNWELSSARASSVVRMLIDSGVPAQRLSVVGLAANQPLVPNDSLANRAKNRRITITMLSPNVGRETDVNE